MTKSKAIKMKCLDCSGGTHKEAKLCQIFDCPLWPFRLGCSMKSTRYKRVMEDARKKYSAEFEVMGHEGINISQFFIEPITKTAHSEPELQGEDEDNAPLRMYSVPMQNTDGFSEKEEDALGDEDELPPRLKLMKK